MISGHYRLPCILMGTLVEQKSRRGPKQSLLAVCIQSVAKAGQHIWHPDVFNLLAHFAGTLSTGADRIDSAPGAISMSLLDVLMKCQLVKMRIRQCIGLHLQGC